MNWALAFAHQKGSVGRYPPLLEARRAQVSISPGLVASEALAPRVSFDRAAVSAAAVTWPSASNHASGRLASMSARGLGLARG